MARKTKVRPVAARKTSRKKAAARKSKASRPPRKSKLIKVRRPREKAADFRQRVAEIVALLKQQYPRPECALRHDNPLQLLVATILSAQCTDQRVNMVTPALFAKYRTAREFADSPAGVLEEEIRSTGFFNSKAKNIRAACDAIDHQHGGMVPDQIDELVDLAGVARKTANVVLGTAYGIAAGVVVDTHVTRLSNLLALTRQQDAVKIERDLMKALPGAEWINFSHRLIWHGREVCIARRPRCGACLLREQCPSGAAHLASMASA
jgi:endonuclease-3